MRVTNSMLVYNFKNDLNSSLKRMGDIQKQMYTGFKFASIADDPVSVVYGLQARQRLVRTGMYASNVGFAKDWLAQGEEALTDVNEIIKTIYETVISASTDAKTADDRKNISSYIGQLRDQIITLSNTTLGNKYVFGGYNTIGSNGTPPGNLPFVVLDDQITLNPRTTQPDVSGVTLTDLAPGADGDYTITVDDTDPNNVVFTATDSITGNVLTTTRDMVASPIAAGDTFTLDFGDFKLNATANTAIDDTNVAAAMGGFASVKIADKADAASNNPALSYMTVTTVNNDADGQYTITVDDTNPADVVFTATDPVSGNFYTATRDMTSVIRQGEDFTLDFGAFKLTATTSVEINAGNAKSVVEGCAQINISDTVSVNTPVADVSSMSLQTNNKNGDGNYTISVDATDPNKVLISATDSISGRVFTIERDMVKNPIAPGNFTLNFGPFSLNATASDTINANNVAATLGGCAEFAIEDKLMYNGVDMSLDPSHPDVQKQNSQNMEFWIAPGIKMDVTFNGVELIGAGAENLFDLVNNLYNDLANGAPVEDVELYISKLQAKENDVLAQLAEYGGKWNRMELMEERYKTDELNYKTMQSNAEDADEAEVIMNFKMAEAVYNAALAAGAKIIQNTLMDYLR